MVELKPVYRMVLGSGALTMVIWQAMAALGQEPPSGEVQSEEPREDTQEILAALEEVGLSASTAEQRIWSAELNGPSNSESGSYLGWSQGEIRSRWSGKKLGSPRGQIKLDLNNNWSRWRGRMDWGPGGAGFKSGAIKFQKGRQSLVVGAIGLQAGCGLLLAAPGRNGSLAADTGFVKPRERIAQWSSTPDGRTVGGAGVALNKGHWSFHALVGERMVQDEPSTRLRMGSISRMGETISWGNSIVALGDQYGHGIWLTKNKGPLQWWGELAHWFHPESAVPDQVLQAVIRLSLQKNWAVQAGWAAASGGRRLPLAARSAFLKGDEGDGWGVRGWWRSRSGVKYSLLWARAATRKTQPSARVLGHTNLDLTVAGKFNRATEFLFRFRTTQQQQWAWSERFRWAVPGLQQEEQQQLLQAGVGWERGPLVLRFKWKHLLRIRDEIAGKRTLYRVSGRNNWGRFHLRWAYGSAWGQDIDLVDAVSPVPGLVQPRHWGKWQTETQLSAGLQALGLDLWLGGIRRKPSDRHISAGSSQFWVQLARKW